MSESSNVGVLRFATPTDVALLLRNRSGDSLLNNDQDR